MNDEEIRGGIHGAYGDEDHYSSFESGQRRHRTRHSSSRYWIWPLIIAVVIETILVVGLLVWVNRAEQEKRELALREQELTDKIKEGQVELEKVRREFNNYKSDKLRASIPNLTPLKLDQVIDINKEYVKSAIFMMVGKRDKKSFEYNLVLENKSTGDIVPRVDMLFFNKTGYQVGMSRIGYNKEGLPNREILERGEIRTVSATMEISNEDEPEFFMVRINKD